MASTSSQPIRVLHLEDNLYDAELIEHRLTRDGIACDISLARDQRTFEDALVRQPLDVVLCDYNLPGYDGLRALQHVKTLGLDTPVIIISGTVGEEEAVKCLHAGATDYLLKQHLERLGPAVRRAIQEADERRNRARAEEALQQREQRMSSIYEAVADMLFYIEVEPDGRYRFVSVNPAFVSTTGLSYNQIVGKLVEEVIPPESAHLVIEHYDRAVRERRIVRWEETSNYPKGRLIGEVSVAPVFDGTGKCTNLVGSVRDVTERRQLEAQLRQAQKMESVGQLAGGIAHDFNNLLTVINGMAELALMHLNENNHRIHDDLREIRQAGERAAALTRQLLAFSRKQILQLRVIDLNATVAEMGKLLKRLLGEDIDLVITPTREPANVKADPGQIEQVIANIAVNARDAMPLGGHLTIETRVIEVDEAFARERGISMPLGPYLALVMRDSGIGMDEATRRQIFEPFFTTKGLGKGTGLGLSTVYGIVKQSGGFIWVESEQGRGSCFTICLPRVDDAPAVRRDPVSLAPPVRGAETVLVVEDVIGLRHLIMRTLETAGYKVLAAANGEEALSVLERYAAPVHLMLTDVVMPGMSGRELASRLDRVRPDMRVLYMSGYTDDVVLRHGLEQQQGVRFVSKPFGTIELIRTVREALDEQLSR